MAILFEKASLNFLFGVVSLSFLTIKIQNFSPFNRSHFTSNLAKIQKKYFKEINEKIINCLIKYIISTIFKIDKNIKK